jgi:hypothetical protein
MLHIPGPPLAEPITALHEVAPLEPLEVPLDVEAPPEDDALEPEDDALEPSCPDPLLPASSSPPVAVLPPHARTTSTKVCAAV